MSPSIGMTAAAQDRLVSAFRRLVAGRLGMHRLPQGDAQLLGLARQRARVAGLSAVESYLLTLEGPRADDEWQVLARELTIGESYFFRDRGQMALLEKTILPERLAANAAGRRLRCLSAGCSTGEEPYSLAMLLDRLGVDGSSWDIGVFGLDVNDQALAQARTGRYSEWSLRGVGPEERARHFRRQGDWWEVEPRLRASVRFLQHNLVADPLPCRDSGLAEFDLILCRNVFIYFDAATTARLVAKLAAALRPGGCLLTGHAEIQGVGTHGLTAQLHPGSMVYRRGDALPSRPPIPPLALPPTPSTATRPAGRKITTTAKPRQPTPPPPPASLEALFAQGQYRHMIAIAGSAAAKTPTGLRLLARAHANLGQHAEAESLCRRLADSDPLDAESLFVQAQIAVEQQRDADAVDLLNKALYADSRFVAAYLHLAELLDRQGDGRRPRALREAARRLLAALPADARLPMLEGHAAGEVLRELHAMTEPADG